VIDISNPSSPAPAGTCDTWDAQGVAVSGDYAYVADGFTGSLQVIDIANPGSPTGVGGCHVGDAYGVAVSGSYAYVAASYYGLHAIDLLP
jgi:hypothetical protein